LGKFFIEKGQELMRNRTSRRRSKLDYDECSGVPGTLTRKQVQDALRRGNSLAGADLRRVNLSGLCFGNVDLGGCKMAEADLSRATFRKANLSGASLWRANLKDAILDGATLDDADLDFSNLDGCTIRGARIRKTIFPVEMDEVRQAVRSGHRLRMLAPIDVE
jgi:uncharacterized protein YjbI with pentapeptide repeats